MFVIGDDTYYSSDEIDFYYLMFGQYLYQNELESLLLSGLIYYYYEFYGYFYYFIIKEVDKFMLSDDLIDKFKGIKLVYFSF